MIKMKYGDNGRQVYFENSKYLLLNPYLERDGIRYGSGWVWFYRNDAGEWRCLSEPDNPNSVIEGWVLEDALDYAERVTGKKFELVGAPKGLRHSYPVSPELRSHLPQPKQVSPCWAALLGKCTYQPGCERTCPFYEEADEPIKITMDIEDFTHTTYSHVR